MKKLSYLVCLLIAGLFLISCNKKDTPSPKLALTPAAIELKAGASATVKVANGTMPYAAKEADKAIATAVVTNSDVKVTGVKEGKTTIIVNDNKGITGTITVKVLK